MSATTTTPSPTLLPDPTDEAGAAIAPGRADDLIASLADQQIDDMMSEAAEGGPVGDDDADAAVAVDAALNAASQMGDVATDLVASAAGELRTELDQIDAARTTAAVEPAPAIESTTTIEPVPAPAAEPEPTPAPEPAVVPSPSFNPPARATIEAPAEPAAEEEIEATFETPDMQESSADEVARELAADVALLSTPLPSVVEHDAQERARDPWWRRAFAAVASVPMLVLGAINLPVRPLSDRGREIIGAAGIVTLVNATGLLIYLTMFAHRH